MNGEELWVVLVLGGALMHLLHRDPPPTPLCRYKAEPRKEGGSWLLLRGCPLFLSLPLLT